MPTDADGGRDTAETLRSLPAEEQQGLALFLSHGVADAATTLLAAGQLGPSVEANPLIRAALEQGYGFAAGIMLLVVGAVAIAYPTVAEIAELPDWYGWGMVAVGVVVAIGNLGVVLT